MAVCEQPSTSIYTDSGNPTMNELSTEPGTDTSSEGSASTSILGSNSKSKKKNGMSIRRSTRLSKGHGDNSDSSSDDDDSDPNIDVGDVLMHDEEKMLEEEEDRANKRKKQMLAVALVKSVVEVQGIPIKKEEPQGHKPQLTQVNTTTNTLNATSHTGSGSGISVSTINEKIKKEALKSETTGILGGKIAGAKVSTSTTTIVVPTTGVSTARVAKVTPSAPNNYAAQTAQTIATRVNISTRSRTRGTKIKTVGLKAQYASVREAPRYIPKPTLPVPNPILSSPALAIQKAPLKNKTKQTAARTSKGKRSNVSMKSEPLAMPPTEPLPTNLLSGIPVKKEEPSTKVNDCALTPTKSNETVANGTVIAPSRRRIFSIDLDPEGFDFDLSMGVVDYGENTSELPPISSTNYNSNSNNSRKPSDASAPSEMPPYRGRGMSFELFSFSIPNLDASADLSSEALAGGRPRGDSIIFDPISFSDGGIHEETALQKSRRGSFKLDESEELNLLNTSGFAEAPMPPQSQQPTGARQTGQYSTTTHRKGVTSTNIIPNPVSTHPAAKVSYAARTKATSGRQTKGRFSTYNHKSGHSSKSKHHLTVVGGNSSSAKEETLHMPQGSAAAAAAAASLSSQILQSTMNGTISHTSCPMELLNKGGRIGIYLPEARRHRIAKFHSKRKNRIWRKRIKYDCRKKLADSRPRVKGRFVKSLEPEEE